MMDDEDGKRCVPNSYGINSQAVENDNYPLNVGKSHEEDNGDDGMKGMSYEEEEEEDDEDEDGNGVQRIGKDDYDDSVDDDSGDFHRNPKKRKLKKSYEFVPRLPALSSASASVPKSLHGGRNPLMGWTEDETRILLDAWGDRFLKRGRKSLRSEEWQEVAEKVSEESKVERTDTQCRNRLDTLKKKYKKEKSMKLGNSASKWMYFEKMDSLLSPLPQQAGLSCRVDSGEYVFMNPKVYLNRSNGLDDMRDSPENLESADESQALPPQRTKNG